VDLRDQDFYGGHIPGCVHITAQQFRDNIDGAMAKLQHAGLVIFHCLISMHRAPMCAKLYKERLMQLGRQQEVAVLEGGFTAWRDVFSGNPRLIEGETLDSAGAQQQYALGFGLGQQFVSSCGVGQQQSVQRQQSIGQVSVQQQPLISSGSFSYGQQSFGQQALGSYSYGQQTLGSFNYGSSNPPVGTGSFKVPVGSGSLSYVSSPKYGSIHSGSFAYGNIWGA
jgi:Cdc25 family phosphatase